MAHTRKPIFSKFKKGYAPRLLGYVHSSPPIVIDLTQDSDDEDDWLQNITCPSLCKPCGVHWSTKVPLVAVLNYNNYFVLE